MKKILLFAILILCHKMVITDDECSGFDTILEQSCSTFLSTVTPSKLCHYYNNNCIEWYNECSQYPPTGSTFDDNVCKAISPSDSKKKCDPQTESGNKVCKEVNKECNDLHSTACFSSSLNLGSEERCLVNNNACELHYDHCNNDNIKSDRTKCNNNIPSDSKKKCSFDGSTCQEVNKECKDLKTGSCLSESLNLEDDERCLVNNNACELHYEHCNHINIKTNRTKCNNNIPLAKNKKCSYDGSTCQEIEKECKDLTKNECLTVTLALKEGERCVLINDQCELHYDDCTNAALTDETKCTNNIPSINTKRCKWTGSSCSLDDRKCDNYIVYSDSNGSNLPCYSLKHDDQKICYYNKNQCIETYAECEKYTEKDSTICKNIIPLKKENDSNEGSYAPDSLNKCEMESNHCTEKPRVCTDYKKRNDDADTLCTQLKSEKDSTNVNAHCILSGEECKDVYLSCESYNLLVTNENNRDENECKLIPTDDYHKCIFENKQCKTEKKNCEEITKDSVCNSHTLDDAEKKCIFKSNSCKEEFKNCDTYKDHYASEPTQIEKSVCEAITPLYDDDKRLYKCVYKDTDSTKTCEKKLIKCEDYEGNNENDCKSLSTSDNTIYKCKLINNKCVTQYIDCEKYNAQITADKTASNKTTCESIELEDESLYRCFYEEDKYCIKRLKLCSEAENEKLCSLYRSLDKNKKCSFENGKCVEKYITEDYKYCSDYRGTDKDICISIQPYNHEDLPSIDDSSRCEYKNNECVRVSKKCDEAEDENECGKITPTDTDKECVFTNNKCVEQYKTCELYNDIDGTIVESVCESIILKDSNKYLTKKCEYTPSVGGAKATCTEETRECSDFKIEFYKDRCTSTNPTDLTKKCIFSNNSCSAVLKTCSELYNLSGATDEKCGKFSTSSNKRCVAKGDGTGCEEVDKSNGNGNTEAKQSYGGKKSLDKIIFILLCLLV